MPAEDVVITAELKQAETPVGEATINIIDNSGVMYLDMAYGDGLHEGGYSGTMPAPFVTDLSGFPADVEVGSQYTFTYSTTMALFLENSASIQIDDEYGDAIFGYVVFTIIDSGESTITFNLA